MPNRKLEVVAEHVYDTWMSVWCDATAQELEEIEGIVSAKPSSPEHFGGHKWMLYLDPRYDAQEILSEIVEKFSVPIPDVFKEG